MDTSDNIRLFIKSLDVSVDQLETSLAPILKKSLDELVFKSSEDGNDQIKRIKFYNNFLYTLIATLFSYLKSVGINTDTHPIMNELNRIKSYMARVKHLQDVEEGKVKTQEQLQQESKNYLQNVLGGGVNGGGAAASDSMTKPAISSSNFKGVHTKFKDEEADKDEVPTKQGKPAQQASVKERAAKSSRNVSKVTKPQKKARK